MSLLRRGLERVSRHLVFCRRLPARFGRRTLWVTPGASLAYYRPLDHRTWNDLYDFAEQCVQPGNCVWDVGANLGVFAFAAAHRAGPAGEVLAIEADGWLAELVRRSAAKPAPGAAPVSVLGTAIAGEIGLQSFATPARARAGSHLISTPGAGEELVGRTRATHPVLTVSLDWLLAHRRPPDVVKIDIEGSELAALTGARELLARHRPRLLLEVYAPIAEAVTRLLHDAGYDLFSFSPDRKDRGPVSVAQYHTLALPRPVAAGIVR